MTVSATVPTGASLFSTTNATSYATSSWSGAGADRTYILVASVVGISLRNGTPSGNGLTWTEETGAARDWDTLASATRRLQVWRARGTATTGATTVDYGAGTNMAGCMIIVVELDGVDGTTNHGVVQAVDNAANSGTAESVTLAAFADAANATLAFWFQDTNAVPTEEGTYTELVSGTHLTPASGGVAAFLASNDTSPTATGSNNAWAGVALEIDALTEQTANYAVAVETDSGLAFLASKLASYAVAVEADSGLAFTATLGGQQVLYAVAIETDSGLAFLTSKQAFYGIALETDTGLAFVHSKLVSYAVAVEADSALAFFTSKLAQYGPASELDTALPYSAVLLVPVKYGIALESDQGLPFEASTARILEGFEVAHGSMGYGRNRRRKIFATGQGRSQR